MQQTSTLQTWHPQVTAESSLQYLGSPPLLYTHTLVKCEKQMLTGKVFRHLRHTRNESPWTDTDKNEKVSSQNKWTKESSSKRQLQWCVCCVLFILLSN